MSGDAEGIVRPPPTDVPALGESTTAILFQIQTNQVKGAWFNVPATVFLLLGVVLQLIDPAVANPVLIGMQFGGTAILVGSTAYVLIRFRRSVSRAKGLLATQAWRPVPASVVGPVLEVRDSVQRWRVRPRGMPEVARLVVARTKRVWIVGPDPKGWFALRIDGSHAAWPARGSQIDAASEERSGTPSAAQISAACARTAARRARFKVGRWREDVALQALVRAGPWQRALIQLRPWRLYWVRSHCKATGMLRLEDGSTIEIALRNVGLDVYANAWETGTLWVAGEPASGRKLAVGFPGFTALGVARFS